MVKVLAEGAEAAVYETSLNGMRALMKRRMQKKYRVPEMDAKIRAVRSKNEARIIAMVSKAGINAPKLLLYDGNDLYMSAISGKKLSDALNSGKVSGRIFKGVGEILGRLHNAGIAHGDYTPANIILGKDGPYVIDFGLSEITNSAEERAFDVLLMKRAVGKAQYSLFLEGYSSCFHGAKDVLGRLALIERRGRYQTRTLA
jgi:TP53 regulating kinase and related kinases